MAEWNAPLPANNVTAGTTGHPAMHNQLVDALTEVRATVDEIELTPGPKGDPGSTGAKGDKGDPGDPGTTTWAGLTDVPASLTSAQAAGTASVRAIGSTATTAAAGNHTHTGLLTGSASAVADATDEADVVAQLNSLLAVLRTRGVLSS